jgi:hypothetical protein
MATGRLCAPDSTHCIEKEVIRDEMTFVKS